MAYEVDFLAVGDGQKSGDAIALRFGNLTGPRDEQTVVVIDGGYQETGEQLVNHIQQYYGTDFVDVVVSTHPDCDHAGGLTVVLEKMKIGIFLMHLPWDHTKDMADMFKSGRVTDASVRESLRKSLDAAYDLYRLAKNKNIKIVEPFRGVNGWNGAFRVLGPTKDFYESLLPHFRGTPEPKQPLGLVSKAAQGVVEFVKKVAESWGFETLTDDGETSPENNSSAIIMITPPGKPDKRLLFTGDAGTPALTLVADHLEVEGFQPSGLGFIQVPHHGSHRNVGPTILDRLLGPKLAQDQRLRSAFVSASKDGAPKHPNKKVTNAFRRRGTHVHATQGVNTRHHSDDAPSRPTWVTSEPLPFYSEVDE